MKKSIVKFLCLLLSALTVGSFTVSCGGGGDTPPTSSSSESNSSSEQISSGESSESSSSSEQISSGESSESSSSSEQISSSESSESGELSLLERYGMTASVTYYANGGEFLNGSQAAEIWYQDCSKVDPEGLNFGLHKVFGYDGNLYYDHLWFEGLPPLNIGVDVSPYGTPITLTYTGYDFKGWYHVKTNEDGKPIVDAETGLCVLDKEKPVDFDAAELKEGDAWHVGALWQKQVKACVRLVSDIVITDKEGKTFDPTAEDYVKTSNYIRLNDYQTELKLNKSPIDVAEDCDAQFVGYYYDQACTQPIMQELKYQDGQTEDAIVYVKYISKEWTVIRTADGKEDGAKKMFSGLKSSANKYYIARNIDMSGITNIANDANLAATVEGNGFTISNLTFFRSGASGKYGLFSTVKSTANVKNLNFANVSFMYGLKADSEIYFVFEKMEEGATIENVTLSGTISIGGSANVMNMMNGYTNCLFGGFASDAEYLAAYPNGFKVLGNPEEFITKK